MKKLLVIALILPTALLGTVRTAKAGDTAGAVLAGVAVGLGAAILIDALTPDPPAPVVVQAPPVVYGPPPPVVYPAPPVVYAPPPAVVYQPVPVPVYQPVPVYRPVPAYRPVPVYRPVPAHRPVPAVHKYAPAGPRPVPGRVMTKPAPRVLRLPGQVVQPAGWTGHPVPDRNDR